MISGEEPRVLETSEELPEDDCLDRYSSSSAGQGVSDDLGQKEPARPTQAIPQGSEDPDFQKTFVEYEETDTSSSPRGGCSLASVVSPPRGRKAGMPKFLHLELSSQLFPSSMIVTVVYAKCTRLERSVLWGSLEELRPEGDKLWLVGGDFNVISSMEEHSAGVLARPGAMEDFNNLLCLLDWWMQVLLGAGTHGRTTGCGRGWIGFSCPPPGRLDFQSVGAFGEATDQRPPTCGFGLSRGLL
ncbi:hypothetical protein ZIOFF_052844 [Zingiber officinale]|uniref:Uncharacterized protein n=1 Tax=Zingiber officinale TaxID=94328 RepID=A0A8J5KVT7_ZINOF|nr:hypothetical protein ZIOFF_052844 [Zingiber officinale]